MQMVGTPLLHGRRCHTQRRAHPQRSTLTHEQRPSSVQRAFLCSPRPHARRGIIVCRDCLQGAPDDVELEGGDEGAEEMTLDTAAQLAAVSAAAAAAQQQHADRATSGAHATPSGTFHGVRVAPPSPVSHLRSIPPWCANRDELFWDESSFIAESARTARRYDMMWTCTRVRADGSRKAFYKEFKKVVELSDVIIQVLDARDPLATRCGDVERYIRSVGVGKKIVLVLNKIGAPHHVACDSLHLRSPHSHAEACLVDVRVYDAGTQ